VRHLVAKQEDAIDFLKNIIFSLPGKGFIMKIAMYVTHNNIYHMSIDFYGLLHMSGFGAYFGLK